MKTCTPLLGGTYRSNAEGSRPRDTPPISQQERTGKVRDGPKAGPRNFGVVGAWLALGRRPACASKLNPRYYSGRTTHMLPKPVCKWAAPGPHRAAKEQSLHLALPGVAPRPTRKRRGKDAAGPGAPVHYHPLKVPQRTADSKARRQLLGSSGHQQQRGQKNRQAAQSRAASGARPARFSNTSARPQIASVLPRFAIQERRDSFFFPRERRLCWFKWSEIFNWRKTRPDISQRFVAATGALFLLCCGGSGRVGIKDITNTPTAADHQPAEEQSGAQRTARPTGKAANPKTVPDTIVTQ